MTDEERNKIIEEQDKELEKFNEYCQQQLPILREQERNFDRSSIKTWEDSKKYWRLRETIMIFNDVVTERKYNSEAEYYRDCMQLAVECLEQSKTISEEIQANWYEKHACMETDFVRAAHCKVGTQYFPTYGELAVGEEKKIWEEVIELGYRFHKLRPVLMEKRYEAARIRNANS